MIPDGGDGGAGENGAHHRGGNNIALDAMRTVGTSVSDFSLAGFMAGGMTSGRNGGDGGDWGPGADGNSLGHGGNGVGGNGGDGFFSGRGGTNGDNGSNGESRKDGRMWFYVICSKKWRMTYESFIFHA